MKFSTPNIVLTDPIPGEIRIYYSKSDAVLKLVFLLIGFGIGAWFLILGPTYYAAGLIVCILTSIFIYVKGSNFFSVEPRVIINSKGIQTDTVPFSRWEDMKDLKVKEIGWGKRGSHFLYYLVRDRQVSIKIDNLNITPADLEKLVSYYQGQTAPNN